MTLIVQVPCFNEEVTLPWTLTDIPRTIPDVDTVEILVIDDGSFDRTAEVVLRAGADDVVRHKTDRGLAETFRTGINACLSRGADIIVNTGGNNQYTGRSIPDLIRPILEHLADVVIGDRQIAANPYFSWSNKRLQALGTLIVRPLSRTARRTR
jgi:glycosyltransferase involved in cell wall biosynthesis